MSVRRFSDDKVYPARVKLDGREGLVINESIMLSFSIVNENDLEDVDDPEMLGNIYVQDVSRRHGGTKGRASNVLDSLCAWADERKLDIFLYPTGGASLGGLTLNHGQLCAWYGRHGFVDYENEMMVRRHK